MRRKKEHARQQTAEDEKTAGRTRRSTAGARGSGVSEEPLTHYDRVLKLRGSALAPVYEDESCSACRVRLRPQVFQDVKSSDEFVTCFYCNRILYFVPPPPKEEEAGKSEKASATEPAKQEAVQADEATAH